MPDQLFYNTGISTYVWIVTNRKEKHRRGKVQLINAVSFYQKMRKSLGNKRNEIGDGREGRPDHIGEITRIYGEFKDGEFSKIFDGTDFGYRRITIERPLRLNFQVSQDRIDRVKETKAFQNLATSKKKDKKAVAAEVAEGEKQQEEILSVLSAMIDAKVYKNRDSFEEVFKKAFKKAGVALAAPLKRAILGALSERDEEAEICTGAKGDIEADSDLRDYENVPLKEDIQTYFEREVLPHVPDAWINESVVDEDDVKVGKVGYEINFNRYFYKYEPPRPLEEIDADIKKLEAEIMEMLREVTA